MKWKDGKLLLTLDEPMRKKLSYIYVVITAVILVAVIIIGTCQITIGMYKYVF